MKGRCYVLCQLLYRACTQCGHRLHCQSGNVDSTNATNSGFGLVGLGTRCRRRLRRRFSSCGGRCCWIGWWSGRGVGVDPWLGALPPHPFDPNVLNSVATAILLLVPSPVLVEAINLSQEPSRQSVIVRNGCNSATRSSFVVKGAWADATVVHFLTTSLTTYGNLP